MFILISKFLFRTLANYFLNKVNSSEFVRYNQSSKKKMPKKISTNSKSLEAREKKAAIKKSANEKAAKDAEDKLWEDDDKNLAKKKQKKEEEERKKAELLKKKAEKKALLEEEMASIKITAKQSIQKITQAQIQAEVEKRNKVIENLNAPPKAVS